MSLAVAGQLARGLSPATEAALVKDLGTELEQRIPELIAQTLGRYPESPATPELLRTLAYVEQVSRSEEHTSELQSLMRTSYAVFCLTKNTTTQPSTARSLHTSTSHPIAIS